MQRSYTVVLYTEQGAIAARYNSCTRVRRYPDGQIEFSDASGKKVYSNLRYVVKEEG